VTVKANLTDLGVDERVILKRILKDVKFMMESLLNKALIFFKLLFVHTVHLLIVYIFKRAIKCHT
jgi:hypothetical protein